MFRHRGAILKESSSTKKYKSNTLNSVLHRPHWNKQDIKILKYIKI